MSYSLELPWPPRNLSPNARCHWRTKARSVKKYRQDCYYLALQKRQTPESFNLRVTFHPPDAHKRDDDNKIGSFKAGRDGLADAWGVDDNIFEIDYQYGDPVKGGCVKIETLEAQ